MSTIACSWEELKRMAKEFHDSLASMNEEELDSAWKCLALGYLGMHEEKWAASAVALIRIMSREYEQRLAQLIGVCDERAG